MQEPPARAGWGELSKVGMTLPATIKGKNMPRRNLKVFHRRYLNRRLIHDKRLFKAYVITLNNVVETFSNNVNKGIKGFSTVKEIERVIQRSRNIVPIIKKIYNDGIFFGLTDVEESYGKPLPIAALKKTNKVEITKLTREEFESVGLGDTEQAVRDQAFTKVSTISQSYRTAIVSQLTQAIEGAESQKEVVIRLREAIPVLKEQNKYIAQRIARTETTRVFNAGSLRGYEKSTVAKGKGWSTNMFGAPRKAHELANQQEVGINDYFVVGGESVAFPGDPDGSPENVINCMCGLYPVISI